MELREVRDVITFQIDPFEHLDGFSASVGRICKYYMFLRIRNNKSYGIISICGLVCLKLYIARLGCHANWRSSNKLNSNCVWYQISKNLGYMVCYAKGLYRHSIPWQGWTLKLDLLNKHISYVNQTLLSKFYLHFLHLLQSKFYFRFKDMNVWNHQDQDYFFL